MSPLQQALLDLLWAAWTELGVPGGSRPLQSTAVDPEPLLLVTPLVFDLDPRLRDEVLSWCVQHHARISTSRLRGLRSQSANPEPWDRLASSLRESAGVRWPGQGEPWPVPARVRQHTLRIERPSLLRFRARALAGVGARADVLCELLARPQSWVRASELGELGYTKRAVAGILSELAQAGLASSRAQGNARLFQLAHPSELLDMLRAEGLAMPSWRHLGALVEGAVALQALEPKTATVRDVRAHQLRESLAGTALRLGLSKPPETSGMIGAWQGMVAWMEVAVGAKGA